MTTQEPTPLAPTQPAPPTHAQQPAYAQPAPPAPTGPPAQTAQTAQTAPASGLAIAGLILAFFAAPIGLVLSIVAFAKRRRVGASVGLPLAGIIVSALVIIGTIAAIAVTISMLTQVAAICNDLGPGVWEAGGVTYTCG